MKPKKESGMGVFKKNDQRLCLPYTNGDLKKTERNCPSEGLRKNFWQMKQD